MNTRFLTLAMTSGLLFGQHVQASAPAPAPDQRAALITAICTGNSSEVNSLISNYPELCAVRVPIECDEDISLLHYAAASSSATIVQILCEHDVALDECTAKGNTALGLAAIDPDKTQNALILIKAYTTKGISVDLHNNPAPTPFIMAACTGNVRLAQALYEAGADATATDNDKDTALLCAVKKGDEHFVGWFLGLAEAASVVHNINEQEFNALDYAVDKKHACIAGMLRETGATHTGKYTKVVSDRAARRAMVADYPGECPAQ